MSFNAILLKVIEHNEALTAEGVVGRLIDHGYKNVPTLASVAKSLNQNPDFIREIDPDNKKRIYRRRLS